MKKYILSLVLAVITFFANAQQNIYIKLTKNEVTTIASIRLSELLNRADSIVHFKHKTPVYWDVDCKEKISSKERPQLLGESKIAFKQPNPKDPYSLMETLTYYRPISYGLILFGNNELGWTNNLYNWTLGLEYRNPFDTNSINQVFVKYNEIKSQLTAADTLLMYYIINRKDAVQTNYIEINKHSENILMDTMFRTITKKMADETSEGKIKAYISSDVKSVKSIADIISDRNNSLTLSYEKNNGSRIVDGLLINYSYKNTGFNLTGQIYSVGILYNSNLRANMNSSIEEAPLMWLKPTELLKTLSQAERNYMMFLLERILIK
ncbi:MAG: hypothetical protein HYZ42_04875 [Bacteroidetes bacterium]|nr:hypothetical protein [Bacteroidota bacterium]